MGSRGKEVALAILRIAMTATVNERGRLAPLLGAASVCLCGLSVVLWLRARGQCRVRAVVLGIAQDGGVPHIGCTQALCVRRAARPGAPASGSPRWA